MAVGDTDNPLWRQRDPYGEGILASRFDWRDKRIIEAISKFVQWGMFDSKGNIKRQSKSPDSSRKSGKTKRSTGALMRSVKWKTWQEAGGDVQVFHAHFLYYSKFVELALGRGNPFIGLPPGIPGKQWGPIRMPDGRSRRARPSIPTEMRKRARKFTGIVRDHFSFTGIAMLLYAMRSDDPMADQINRRLFRHGLTGRANW